MPHHDLQRGGGWPHGGIHGRVDQLKLPRDQGGRSRRQGARTSEEAGPSADAASDGFLSEPRALRRHDRIQRTSYPGCSPHTVRARWRRCAAPSPLSYTTPPPCASSRRATPRERGHSTRLVCQVPGVYTSVYSSHPLSGEGDLNRRLVPRLPRRASWSIRAYSSPASRWWTTSR